MKIFYLISSIILFWSCENKTVESKNTTKIIIPPPSSPPSVDTTKIIKANILLDYLSKVPIIKPNKENGIPFDTLNYDKIIGYDFEGSEEPYPSILDSKNNFVPVILGQQYLTQKQADKIMSALTKNSSYGEQTAACFNPHFALLFIKENRIKNKIDICLDCNYLITDLTIPAETHLKYNKGKENEYAITGFTLSGRKAIIDLCKELNFEYGKYKIRSF